MNIPNIRIGDTNYCTYCGVIPETWDHVIPVHWCIEGPRKPEHANQGILTPACSQCNCHLGAMSFPTFKHRLVNVFDYYASQKLSTKPQLTYSELDTLNDELFSRVYKIQQANRRLVGQKNWRKTKTIYRIISDIHYKLSKHKTAIRKNEYLFGYFDGLL